MPTPRDIEIAERFGENPTEYQQCGRCGEYVTGVASCGECGVAWCAGCWGDGFESGDVTDCPACRGDDCEDDGG